MASLNASVTSTGLISTGDATGNLILQSDGTTGLSIVNGGKVVLANTALSTASAGTLEYDGGELYFTPLGTQRGLVPGMQYYCLNSTVAGTNASGAQSMLGVGLTLSSSTVYAFEYVFVTHKTAGTTNHTYSLQFGGTATLNNIIWYQHYTNAGFAGAAFGGTATHAIQVSNTTSGGSAGTTTTANIAWFSAGRGTISINVGGTFIPQYNLTAAPGGAYTTQIGSYFLIYPIGAAGSNINVGTWA